MDIVSEINLEEVRHATDNASRELSTRFDFRGVAASIEWKKPNVVVKAEGDFQVKQLVDMLRSHLTKRNIDAKAMTVGNYEFSESASVEDFLASESTSSLPSSSSSSSTNSINSPLKLSIM